MNDYNEEVAYSKPVIEFLTVAHEFCLTIENVEKFNFESFKSINQKLLPLVYLKGALLPQIEVEDTSSLIRFVNEEQWEELFEKVKKVFGKQDRFSAIDRESGFEDKIVQISLSEQIVDIYQDLKDFVLLYQQEKRSSKQCALLEVNKLFISNWGRKLPKALDCLHQLEKPENDGSMSDFLSFLDD